MPYTPTPSAGRRFGESGPTADVPAADASTGPDAPELRMLQRCHIDALVDELERHLGVGAFRDARKRLDDELRGDVESELALCRALDGDRRLIFAATVAEIHFYFGENDAGRRLLEQYLERPDIWIGLASVATRVKLQIAEAFYAQRDFEGALRVARAISSTLDFEKEALGISDACYYIVRYLVRKNDLTEASGYYQKALEATSVAAARELITPAGLRWRLGRLFLADGNARWRLGDLPAAMARLSAARDLIATTPDIVARGNVEQSLGCIFRSQGYFRNSLRAFVRSTVAYTQVRHRLNQARAMTNLARTCILYAVQGGDVTDATTLKRLTRARALCDAAESSDPMWKRQLLEVLICESWFHLKGPNSYLTEGRAIQAARESATLALRLASEIGSRANVIEALLALGYCDLFLNRASEARRHFESALQRANELGVRKLIVNCHLSLAELFCKATPNDLSTALRQFSMALTLMDATANRVGPSDLVGSALVPAGSQLSGPESFSWFLRSKAVWIRKMIDADAEGFFLSAEQLGCDAGQLGLKEIVDRARTWAVNNALRKTHGNKQSAATLLGISRQGLHRSIPIDAKHRTKDSHDK